MKKFNMTKLMPGKKLPERQASQISDLKIRNAVEKCKKAVEGYNSDIRAQLWKYSFILEQQRRIMHKRRMDVLLDRDTDELMKENLPQRYMELSSRFGSDSVQKAEKQLKLFFINRLWAEYLDYMAYIKEGIHLMIIGNKDPVTEYNKLAIKEFEDLNKRLNSELLEALHTTRIDENGINMEAEGLKGPSSTWTYLVNDNLSLYARLPLVVKFISQFTS